MNFVQKLLSRSAETLELPADIAANLPRIELLGASECTIEPHKGLLEYSRQEIAAATAIGSVRICGEDLTIKLMNKTCMIVRGHISDIKLQEEPERE